MFYPHIRPVQQQQQITPGLQNKYAAKIAWCASEERKAMFQTLRAVLWSHEVQYHITHLELAVRCWSARTLLCRGSSRRGFPDTPHHLELTVRC